MPCAALERELTYCETNHQDIDRMERSRCYNPAQEPKYRICYVRCNGELVENWKTSGHHAPARLNGGWYASDLTLVRTKARRLAAWRAEGEEIDLPFQRGYGKLEEILPNRDRKALGSRSTSRRRQLQHVDIPPASQTAEMAEKQIIPQ